MLSVSLNKTFLSLSVSCLSNRDVCLLQTAPEAPPPTPDEHRAARQPPERGCQATDDRGEHAREARAAEDGHRQAEPDDQPGRGADGQAEEAVRGGRQTQEQQVNSAQIPVLLDLQVNSAEIPVLVDQQVNSADTCTCRTTGKQCRYTCTLDLQVNSVDIPVLVDQQVNSAQIPVLVEQQVNIAEIPVL